MSIQIETAQNVGVDYEVASVGDRIFAQLIDSLVRFVWAIGVMGLVSVASPKTLGENWIFIGLVLIPALLYTLLCEYFLNGQTIGKMALKIKVIKLDGSKPTLYSYLLRWLFALEIALFSGIVAIITIAVNGKGQRLGDIVAGTTVIKTRPNITLSDIMSSDLSADYQPVYPGVIRLSDKDVNTLRKVLRTNNEKLMDEAMSKVEDILAIHSLEPATEFLTKVINDYHYYANSVDS